MVVIGLLGTVLDSPSGPNRLSKWRPTISLCRHPELPVARLELIGDSRHRQLRDRIIADLAEVSPRTRVNPVEIDLTDPWDFEEVYGALYDFARAYAFNTEREEYLIHITTGTHVAQICLFLLAESRRLPGKLIQTSPPKRRGDPGSYAIVDLDLSRYDLIARRFRQEADDDVSFLKSGIATRNQNFNRLIERVERVAINSRAPVLLTGPTGAGKSLLARRIYQLKLARRQLQGAFVEVNCATLRGELAMSALFGHVKGAFTGASHDKKGLLKEAEGGMLFLDEVAELKPDEQAMLLRALEEKRFLPVGATIEETSDFQLICGTNKSLDSELRRGSFREDLLARINLWTFRLPGLRERPEDIEPNLDFELDQFMARAGQRVSFTREAREEFLAFAVSPASSWRANFRDLNAAVTRLGTLSDGGRISVAAVREEIARLRDSWAGASEADEGLGDLLSPEQLCELDLFDRHQLALVVRVCRQSHNLSEAGRKLYSQSRVRKTTGNDADRLRKYLARWGLDWRSIKA